MRSIFAELFRLADLSRSDESVEPFHLFRVSLAELT